VTPVSDQEFGELLRIGFDREAVHLEMRDAYGTAVELPRMANGWLGSPMTSSGCTAGAARFAAM
jgi:hypothetical protein